MFNVCKGETDIHAYTAVFSLQLQDILSCVRNTYAITAKIKRRRTCAYSFAHIYVYIYIVLRCGVD